MGLVGDIILVVGLLMSPVVAATVYTVGDSTGWTVGADYSTWGSSRTFLLGDIIVFNYPNGHTVNEVSADDYKACTTGSSLSSDSSGATSVALKTAGPHYFICGVPGHCAGGMKLSVTVSAGASGTGPSPSDTPAAVSPPSSTATNTNSPMIPTMTTPSVGVNQPIYASAAAAMEMAPRGAWACMVIWMVVMKWGVMRVDY